MCVCVYVCVCIYIYVMYPIYWASLEVKNPPTNAGDVGLIPGLGRSPGEGKGNPLQYSCFGNPMDSRAGRLQSVVSQKNQTQLSN